jgi:RNA-directed DNA polymerase
MSRTALIRVSSTKALSEAWESISSRSNPRSRASSGVDDETLLDFGRNPNTICRVMSEQLRAPASYEFSPLRAHLIPKSLNKDRVICIPTVRDRIVQRSISDFLAGGDRCQLANEVSFGFIPTRSVKKGVERARALRRTSPWVYKTDITSFFDSIERATLHDKIRRHVRDRSLHGVLKRASECEIKPNTGSHAKRIRKAGIQTGFGVRQGMPLSPFFANLILTRFDQTIIKAGISMVRYADDLICCAKTEADLAAIHDVVGNALLKESLTIPAPGPSSKTKVYAPDEAAEFLGLQLRPQNGNYVLEVSEGQTQKIRDRIHQFATFDSLNRAGINLGGFFRRLDGMLDGYHGAYAFADNIGHLESVLISARRQAVERLFESELKINIEGLAHEKRRFLGIE